MRVVSRKKFISRKHADRQTIRTKLVLRLYADIAIIFAKTSDWWHHSRELIYDVAHYFARHLFHRELLTWHLLLWNLCSEKTADVAFALVKNSFREYLLTWYLFSWKKISTETYWRGVYFWGKILLDDVNVGNTWNWRHFCREPGRLTSSSWRQDASTTCQILSKLHFSHERF